MNINDNINNGQVKKYKLIPNAKVDPVSPVAMNKFKPVIYYNPFEFARLSDPLKCFMIYSVIGQWEKRNIYHGDIYALRKCHEYGYKLNEALITDLTYYLNSKDEHKKRIAVISTAIYQALNTPVEHRKIFM
jgi:hypothetical protein